MRDISGSFWKLRQRFGIAAPRVAVHSHIPWYWRWLWGAVFIGIAAAAAAWMYDAGRRFAGFDRSQIAQELAATGPDLHVVFSPHLLPVNRGILSTIYVRLPGELDDAAVRAANMCRIALHRPPQGSGKGDTLVILSVIDNLTKGAAGQAVQNMNLMFGLAETTGLAQPPVVP